MKSLGHLCNVVQEGMWPTARTQHRGEHQRHQDMVPEKIGCSLGTERANPQPAKRPGSSCHKAMLHRSMCRTAGSYRVSVLAVCLYGCRGLRGSVLVRMHKPYSTQKSHRFYINAVLPIVFEHFWQPSIIRSLSPKFSSSFDSTV